MTSARTVSDFVRDGPRSDGEIGDVSEKMDILDRLLEQSDWHDDGHGPIHLDAATEIERLRAENAKAYKKGWDDHKASVGSSGPFDGGTSVDALRAEVARLQQSLDIMTEEAAAIRARGTT